MEEVSRKIIPWQRRDELGFFRALWETIKEVLLRPVDFFENLQIKDEYSEPFLFYFVLALASVMASFMFAIVFTKGKATAFPFFLFMLILAALIISIQIYVGSGFLHLGVLLFAGKDRSGFKATFNIWSYTCATNIFIPVPFIGIFISYIWGIIVMIIGIKVVHKTSFPRAILILFGPFLVIFFFALLAAIAIPGILRARMTASQERAKVSVMTIGKAIESYAAQKGGYPQDELALKYASPPYLNETYDAKTMSGYSYSVEISPNGYRITASPEKCYMTGTKTFTLENGKELFEQDCKTADKQKQKGGGGD